MNADTDDVKGLMITKHFFFELVEHRSSDIRPYLALWLLVVVIFCLFVSLAISMDQINK